MAADVKLSRLSIPDQRAQTQAWLAQRGWTMVAEYVEPAHPPPTTSALSFSA